jgi:transposase InsO family protein
VWVPHDVRDLVVDFVRCWSEKTEIGTGRFIHWLGVRASKFYDWRERYGRVNEHNGWIPRDFWLAPWEKRAIIDFHREHPLEGYRRLTFMMLDADVVAVSPSSVWRVLQQAGLLSRWKGKPSRKGTGFEQPPHAHQHWHIDVSYINVSGTFYYLCSILDGYSRSIVHWDLRESMTEAEIEVILQRAREKYPDAKPRIISDNGPQFVARDFKEFIRIAGMTPRANLARLSAIERQAGALAQIPKVRVHPARYTVDERRRGAFDSNLRGSLQHRALAQCHRLCDAARYARRATGRNSCGTRSQARGSTSPAAAPAGGKIAACTFFKHDYNDLAR